MRYGLRDFVRDAPDLFRAGALLWLSTKLWMVTYL